MDDPTQPFPSRDEVFGVFGEHVSKGKAEFYQGAGLDIVMGERGGAWFADAYDPQRRWLNCHCNGGVFNLGHRDERVVAAVRAALEHLDIGNHHLVSGHRARLAERLCATAWDGITGVVFGVSGGEAIDLALKVVRWRTGRSGVVSAVGGYHGHTGLALAAGDAQYREIFGGNLPGFTQVPFDDIAALDSAIGDDTAAVVLEPIPATLGMPIPSDGYLQAVQSLCKARGAKLIVDEVQTGLGRTGKVWGYEHEGIEPDVIVTGKGLSGGVYPITATLMTRELHALFDEHPFVHISTFGGAEPGCAAALAVLDVIAEPDFLPRVRALSERFADAFADLPFTLRRRGLMMGLAFGYEGAGMLAARQLLSEGVFCAWANNDTSVLQFLPPLVLDDADADAIIGAVRRVFGMGA